MVRRAEADTRAEVVEVVRPTEADIKDSAAGFNRAMGMDNSHGADFKMAAGTSSNVGTMGAGVVSLCNAMCPYSVVVILVLITRTFRNMGTTSTVVPPQWCWVPPPTLCVTNVAKVAISAETAHRTRAGGEAEGEAKMQGGPRC